MARLSLTMRFFLTLAALTLALIILPALAIRWSVRHDIVDYFQRREFARLQPLQELLIEQWATAQSWQFLQSDPSQLPRLIQQSGINERRLLRWPRPSERAALPPPGEGEPQPLHQRLQIVDDEGRLVVGHAPPPGVSLARQPLEWQGRSIGELRLHIPPFVRDGLEQRFLSGQLNTLLVISGVAMLLALVVAWWLGRSLARPILSVAGTVRELAQGKLDARTAVRSEDEIGALARDVDRLAETLTANEKLRREAMADISHEFRTPLALMQGKIEAMQDGVLPSDAATLHSLHDATRRLSRMVDDLYHVALADTGALRLELQTFDMRQLLEQALQDNAAQLQAAGLRVQLEGDAPLLLRADRQRLRQVLDNLLHNSCRYTDAGGVIRVTLHRHGEQMQLLLEDSSPGVPAAALPQLFQRFFRVEGSRSRDAGGSGLGLSVVKAIIQAHGGNVSAAPSSLGGLAIQIELPVQAFAEPTA
ncbi:MAG: ATP-binding protein [Permianibacter sp.]